MIIYYDTFVHFGLDFPVDGGTIRNRQSQRKSTVKEVRHYYSFICLFKENLEKGHSSHDRHSMIVCFLDMFQQRYVSRVHFSNPSS